MPDAIPARRTGTELVSERDAGVPAKPTPMPTNAYPSPTFQYGDVLLPEQQHREEPEQAEDVADEQREPGAVRLDEPRGARRDQHHAHRRRDDRQPGVERRVAEHVLEELLADEHRSHERPEDDDPGAGGDPEDPAACDLRSKRGFCARRWRMTKASAAASATAASPSASAPLFGTGAKLIASTSVPTSTTESTPPRLSTVSVVSLTWLGTNASASTSATAASGKVIRNTEPHQKCSRSRPESSGPSAEIAPPSADHSAIDLVRAGPDQSAVISASVVGNAMPAETPPRIRARMSTPSDGAYAARRQAGIESATPRTSINFRP